MRCGTATRVTPWHMDRGSVALGYASTPLSCRRVPTSSKSLSGSRDGPEPQTTDTAAA